MQRLNDTAIGESSIDSDEGAFRLIYSTGFSYYDAASILVKASRPKLVHRWPRAHEMT